LLYINYSGDTSNLIMMDFVIPHNLPTIGREEVTAITDAIKNREFTNGTRVEEFEVLFSGYMGRKSAATSSGTSALHLALIALGISVGDEVILPSYVCTGPALGILYLGAKPVLTDIEYDFNISVSDLERKITEKTKAVIVPHMFGYPANLAEIKELLDKKNIYLIEACAQAVGATYDKRLVGAFGDISCFSFSSTKVISSIQGGMICSDNMGWIETVKDIRYYDKPLSIDLTKFRGRDLMYDHDPRMKYTYRMSDVEAAMGIVQLKKLDSFIKRRRRIAKLYNDELKSVTLPPTEDKKRHIYYRYVIRSYVDNLKFAKALNARNILVGMPNTPPLHHRAILGESCKGEFPKTSEVIKSAISLPIYPSLTDEEAQFVVDNVNKVANYLSGGQQ